MMKSGKWLVLVLAALSWIATARDVEAAPIVIDFEDLATSGPGGDGPLVRVTDQYAGKGITFNGALAIDYSRGLLAIPGFAHSGTKGIEQCVGVEFCRTPISMSFTNPQKRVKVWFGYRGLMDRARPVILLALDGNGVEVGRSVKTLNASASLQPIRLDLEVVISTPRIRSARLEFLSPDGLAFNDFLSVDDVEFDIGGNVGGGCPPGTIRPTISLRQPSSTPTVHNNAFDLQGEISRVVAQ